MPHVCNSTRQVAELQRSGCDTWRQSALCFAISLISKAVKVFCSSERASGACSLCAHAAQPLARSPAALAGSVWRMTTDPVTWIARNTFLWFNNETASECVMRFRFHSRALVISAKTKAGEISRRHARRPTQKSNSFVGHKVLLAKVAKPPSALIWCSQPTSHEKWKPPGCKKCILAHNCV